MVLLNPLAGNGYGARQDKLTFHYGAIKPIFVICIRKDVDKLTFHYGAIKPR